MQNRNTAIMATLAAVVLCGCPGLFLCLFGALTAGGRGTFNEESLSPGVGFALICVALILLLIPVAVGAFTLRKKPEVRTEEVPPTS